MSHNSDDCWLSLPSEIFKTKCEIKETKLVSYNDQKAKIYFAFVNKSKELYFRLLDTELQ